MLLFGFGMVGRMQDKKEREAKRIVKEVTGINMKDIEIVSYNASVIYFRYLNDIDVVYSITL